MEPEITIIGAVPDLHCPGELPSEVVAAEATMRCLEEFVVDPYDQLPVVHSLVRWATQVCAEPDIVSAGPSHGDRFEGCEPGDPRGGGLDDVSLAGKAGMFLVALQLPFALQFEVLALSQHAGGHTLYAGRRGIDSRHQSE